MQLSTEKKGVNTGTAHIGFSRGIAVEHGAMLPRLNQQFMYKKFNPEYLIQGIEAFILKNRCSLSNEDLVLLNDCLSFLKSSAKTKKLSFEDVGKFLWPILKFLSTTNDIWNLIH